MKAKTVYKKILILKLLLNTLLNILSPGNALVIYISQALDKHISHYQTLLYRRYSKRNNKVIALDSKAA